MHTIDKNITTLDPNGRGLSTEASTAGLAPGDWPEIIAVTNEADEGFLFFRSSAVMASWDMGAFQYRTKDGDFTLTIFND